MDLLRNGSGYPDPTAYEAIKNIMEEKNMKKGEVWRIQKGAKEALAVILSVREPVAAILELFGDWRNYDNVEVKTLFGNTFYVQPMYMQYCYENNFIEQEDALTQEMFQGLQQIIADCLELPVPQPELHKLEENQDQKIISDLQDLIVKLEAQLEEREEAHTELAAMLEERKQTIKNLEGQLEEREKAANDMKEVAAFNTSQLDVYAAALADAEKDLSRITTERDIYKTEFKTLQSQLMQR